LEAFLSAARGDDDIAARPQYAREHLHVRGDVVDDEDARFGHQRASFTAPASRAWIVATRFFTLMGLVSKPSNPASRMRAVSSGIAEAVTATMGIRRIDLSARMRLNASMPSIPGSW